MESKWNIVSGSVCKSLIAVSFAVLFLTIHLMLLTSSQAGSLMILGTSPSAAPNNFDTTIVITGTDFQVTVSGSLVLTAPTVRLGEIVLPLAGSATSRTLTAIAPWGLDEGVYPISIENADGTTATLTNAFTVTAGLGTWTTGGPYGGTISHLEMDEHVTSTLYAQLGDVGLFKSENSGDNWYNVFPGYILAHIGRFTLKPGEPQTIYLSGSLDDGDRLFRSSNGGEDWEVILEYGRWALGVSPTDPDYLYIGNEETIMRSTDSGDTWQTVDNGIPTGAVVEILAVHPITPTIVYAGLDGGRVYKTVDGGANWTATSANFGHAWWSVLEVDPHAPKRMYASGWHIGNFIARSLDGGESWESMNLGPSDLSSLDIEFHPTISGTMYAQTNYGVYSSTNAGETWGDQLPMAPEYQEVRSFLLHPQTGLPYYMGHIGKAILRSDNGGIDWQVRNHGLTGLTPHEVAPSPADPRYIYLGADAAGGFVSNNGGQSWLAVDGPDRGISVAADPHSPTVAYLGARRDVYKTTDGGQNWTPHELPGLPNDNEMRVHAIAIDPNNPKVVYAGPGTWDFVNGIEYGWLYRSLDAGQSWSPLTVTFAISSITDIVIDPTDSQTIYVATGRRFSDSTNKSTGIIKTVDGGDSWEFVNQGLPALNISRLAINPDDPQILYAGANPSDFVAGSGVFKTVDGGTHWEQVAEGLYVSGLEIHPLMTDTVYVGAYGAGLLQSSDAGASWESVEGPLGQLPSLCLNVTQASSRTMVYAGISGGLINLPAMSAIAAARAAASDEQFFGSGVYQLTIDHRHHPSQIYLPLVMRN